MVHKNDEKISEMKVKNLSTQKMASTTTTNFPILSLSKPPKFHNPSISTFLSSSSFPQSQPNKELLSYMVYRKKIGIVCGLPLLIDPWAPTIDSQSIATQLFAFSLFPYIGFLYFITKSKTAPNLTLFGFYFLLAFVGATIPAGIYAKVHYGTSLSNVDWLHGGAESLLTLTNLFIVLGLRMGLRKTRNAEQSTSTPNSVLKEK